MHKVGKEKPPRASMDRSAAAAESILNSTMRTLGILLVVASVAIHVLLLALTSSLVPSIAPIHWLRDSLPSLPASLLRRQTSKVTLVALQYGTAVPYPGQVSQLFDSVRRQSDRLNLVWVNVHDGEGCVDVPPWITSGGQEEGLGEAKVVKTVSNVETICLSREDVRVLTAVTLCAAIEGCPAEPEKTEEIKRVLDNGNLDLEEIRPLWGEIFAEHVKTEWWAAISPDTFLGDFETLFPWEISNSFDIITVTPSRTSPIYLDDHFTAYKQTPKLRSAWSSYSPLSSLVPGSTTTTTPPRLNLPPKGLSEYLLKASRANLNWLALPEWAGRDPTEDTKVVVTNDGVVAHVWKGLPLLDLRAFLKRPRSYYSALFKPHFSDEAIVRPLDFSSLPGSCHGSAYNPSSFCPIVTASYTHRTYILRRNGTFYERLEPLQSPRGAEYRLVVEPKLVNSFERLAGQSWFELPYFKRSEAGVLEVSMDWAVRWDPEEGRKSVVPRSSGEGEGEGEAEQPDKVEEDVLGEVPMGGMKDRVQWMVRNPTARLDPYIDGEQAVSQSLGQVVKHASGGGGPLSWLIGGFRG